jgi:hypothetical protein
MEWFIFWIGINALIGYAIGRQKNEVGAAVAASILLGPIGWILAILSGGHLRKCPHCAELVKPEAIVCKHCRRDLPAAVAAAPLAPRKYYNGTLTEKILLGFTVVLVGIAIAVTISTVRTKQDHPWNHPPAADSR